MATKGIDCACALMMNQARQQLFSGAAFGFNENVCAAARRLPRSIQRLVKDRGTSDQPWFEAHSALAHTRCPFCGFVELCAGQHLPIARARRLPLWGRRISNLLRRPALAIDRAHFILTSQAEVLE